MTNALKIERASAALLITIDREAKRNALSSDVSSELLAAIDRANASDDVSAIVIRGAGKAAFSAGADLKERAAADADGKWRLSRALLDVNRALLASPKIAFASIQGWCLGGGLELALACDFRLADASARFGWPELKLGAYPGAGAAVLLPRIVGPQHAKRLLLDTANINAERALAIGLIDELTPNDPVEACLAMAERLRFVAPLARAAVKASLAATMHLPLDEAFAADGRFRQPLESTRDYREGIKAHFEKRDPVFVGK